MVYTVGAGYWHDPTRWNTGVVPGAGDTVVLYHAISATTYMAFKSLGIYGGGKLTLSFSSQAEAVITIDDAAGAGIFIAGDTGGDSGIGLGLLNSKTFPTVIQSAGGANPIHPYTFIVDPLTGNDWRDITLGNIDMRDISPTLRCGASQITFNIPGGTAWLNNVPPVSREPILVEHPIDGRGYSRIYQRGAKAGITTLTGFVEWSSFYYNQLRTMISSGSRFSFASRYVQLPKCRVSGKVGYPTKPGQTYVPFSLTLIEDM